MVTIADIAKSLGVTPSTVSRSLSGSPRVKESTRDAVLRKAEELGYQRNVIASGLRRGTADLVGIIVPRINREFFSNVISGAESVLEKAGYSVFICQSHEKTEDEIHALRMLRSYRVAGVFISHAISSWNAEHIKANLNPETVLVQFDRVFSSLPGTKVINDNFKGAYDATSHLISQGYTRIGTLAGAMTSEAFLDRLDGYKKALEDAGLPVDEDIIFYDSILRETGYDSALKAFGRGCDALYSAGDFSALGAVQAARDCGKSIPGDFGIVGTADEHFASLMSPALSSIAQHPYEMGRVAAEAFLQSVRTGEAPGEITVPMELMKRESSTRI